MMAWVRILSLFFLLCLPPTEGRTFTGDFLRGIPDGTWITQDHTNWTRPVANSECHVVDERLVAKKPAA